MFLTAFGLRSWSVGPLVVAVVVTAGLFGPRSNEIRAAQGPIETSSTTSMTMSDGPGQPTAGAPYPSEIVVSAFNQPGAVIDEISVKLTGLSSGEAANDLDVMMVGPDGTKAILLSDVGGSANVAGATVTIDDDAASPMPATAALGTGTFRPSNYEALDAVDSFPAPAPSHLDAASVLSTFEGRNPNGTWKLFVVDDVNNGGGDGGLGSWSLIIETSMPPSITTSPARHRTRSAARRWSSTPGRRLPIRTRRTSAPDSSTRASSRARALWTNWRSATRGPAPGRSE